MMHMVYGDVGSGQNRRFTKNNLASESIGRRCSCVQSCAEETLAALSASLFTMSLMGPVKAKGLVLNSAAW